ncbi:hypothetical protein CL656_00805 [bacterium]|nr:hypothetical protein [bacterium]|tara:strand:+ start:9912 stop:10478 length:567 start_codon:yes stop_codon:yes gene_type:complete
MENNLVSKINYVVLSIIAGFISSGIGLGLFLAFSKAGITIESGLSFAIIFILVFNFVVLINNILGGYFYNVAYRLPSNGISNLIIKLSISQVVLNLIALPFVFMAIAKGMLAIFMLTVCFISINNLFEILISKKDQNFVGAAIGCFLTLMIGLTLVFNIEDLQSIFVPLNLLILVLSNFLESLGAQVN